MGRGQKNTPEFAPAVETDLAPLPTRQSASLRYIDCALPLAEKALIQRIRRYAGRRPARQVITGIGDDCAILRVPPGHEVLVTTDFSLEGIHFRREWHPARSVGHRCLVRGLSDIAAMGGEPIAAFLSLALPKDVRQAWVDQFMDGFVKLARKFHVTLAGGDTAESPRGVLADIVVLGSVPRGQAVLRSGARPDDTIYVTGKLGGSSATLDLLRKDGGKLSPSTYPQHFYPVPRLTIGRALREKRLASAMIDISDGLSTDLGHICEESGVGARIQADRIPCAEIGKQKVDLDFALHGGEDYELLFTAPRERRIPSQTAGVAITKIGAITRKNEVFLERDEAEKLEPRGWEHFKT
jgi:thiamine-monophosphate kinase